MDYPHAPGAKVDGPSQEAAEYIAASVNELQRSALREISNHAGGLTADEVAGRLGIDKHTVRSRCSELRNLGKIMDSSVRRKNQSGRSATVWVRKIKTDLFY